MVRNVLLGPLNWLQQNLFRRKEKTTIVLVRFPKGLQSYVGGTKSFEATLIGVDGNMLKLDSYPTEGGMLERRANNPERGFYHAGKCMVPVLICFRTEGTQQAAA